MLAVLTLGQFQMPTCRPRRVRRQQAKTVSEPARSGRHQRHIHLRRQIESTDLAGVPAAVNLSWEMGKLVESKSRKQ